MCSTMLDFFGFQAGDTKMDGGSGEQREMAPWIRCPEGPVSGGPVVILDGCNMGPL